MISPNNLLSRIESARMWAYFHKDWLLQMRQTLRNQLPNRYHVFVESEAVLITPDGAPMTAVMPDVSVGRSLPSSHLGGRESQSEFATTALIEVEEPCEIQSQYSLVVRRSPEHQIVAVMELLSPSNKGIGNQLDRTKYLRKRSEYLDAGINLLEIDALLHGDRDLPSVLTQLQDLPRVAWTATYLQARRLFRGWGWGTTESLPTIDWRIDENMSVLVELEATLIAAAEFNDWEAIVN